MYSDEVNKYLLFISLYTRISLLSFTMPALLYLYIFVYSDNNLVISITCFIVYGL